MDHFPCNAFKTLLSREKVYYTYENRGFFVGLRRIMGIDPGNKGAFVVLHGRRIEAVAMPLVNGEISYPLILETLERMAPDQIFLERAVAFGMGAKGAFTYGRGFAAVEIAIQICKLPVTYVEPGTWTKEIFQGVDSRLKPKERGKIALQRLFPELIATLPADRKGNIHEGVRDALMIAEYGRRLVGRSVSVDDF